MPSPAQKSPLCGERRTVARGSPQWSGTSRWRSVLSSAQCLTSPPYVRATPTAAGARPASSDARFRRRLEAWRPRSLGFASMTLIADNPARANFLSHPDEKRSTMGETQFACRLRPVCYGASRQEGDHTLRTSPTKHYLVVSVFVLSLCFFVSGFVLVVLFGVF